MTPEVGGEKELPEDELIENAKIIFAYTLEILQNKVGLQNAQVERFLANTPEPKDNNIVFDIGGRRYTLTLEREAMRDYLSLFRRGIQQDLNVEGISFGIFYKEKDNEREVERAFFNYEITPKMTDLPTDVFGNDLIAIERILWFLRFI